MHYGEALTWLHVHRTASKDHKRRVSDVMHSIGMGEHMQAQYLEIDVNVQAHQGTLAR